jgi:hypothetical protein
MAQQTNINPTLEDMRPDAGAYFIGEFGGKNRYIKFDLNAFAEMERLYGDMDKANEALSKGSMADIRKILWLGLIWDEAVLDETTGEPIRYNITPYQVGSWLDTTNMKKVIGDLTAAINGSLPKEAVGPDNQPVASVVPITQHALAAAGEEPDPNSQNPISTGIGLSTTTSEQ